jgi:hypothetical protein
MVTVTTSPAITSPATTPVKPNLVVNGYEISKIECSSYWGVIKVGLTRGKIFYTKKQAIAFATSN